MTDFATASRFLLPVSTELICDDLAVEGEIPPALFGMYVRNGPNSRSGGSAHPFFGDGMLHAVWLEGGKALRYANRYIETSGEHGLRGSVANTSVLAHAGRIFALVEVAFPREIRRDLSTVGPFDFGGKLTTPMTAHPKICPSTGELHFFGAPYAPPLPALTYHRASASGELLESQVIDVPGHTMMHDFAITENHIVFMDLPVAFDRERAKSGTMPFRWSDSYGARFGILPRGNAGSITWVAVEPCYVFHVLNAYDDETRLVVDAMRYPELWRNDASEFARATLHRWTIDVPSGTVHEEQLDNLATEFPRINEAHTGRGYRFGYATHFGNGNGELVKYDLVAQTSARCGFGRGRTPGDAEFVAAPVARDLSLAATVHLPQRVPYGFHGAWINADV
ncbi:MAG: carotenoid oxygenase family protein [Vulcanimicrobiaceae bacterium]